MADKRILKATLIISVATLLSRVLGILRDVLLADMVGLGFEKSAYDLAFLVPDIINHIVSTGYLSITFIPIFTAFMVKKQEDKGWEFFSHLLKLFSLTLIPFIVLCWIFIRPILELLTDSSMNPKILDLAVTYSRIILPAQICFFYAALFTAIQHVKMRFLFPALMGLFYNGAIIIGGWLGRAHGLYGFCWGVLGGALIGGLALQLFGAYRVGMKVTPGLPKINKSVLRYAQLTLPLVLGLGAVFALEFVLKSFGSRFGENGISSLGYAYRIMYTLVAVFGFAVGAASYPVLSKFAKEDKIGQMNELLFRTLSQIVSILLPATLVIWYLARPITQVLLERGAFSQEATQEVAGLLQIYIWSSFGLSAQIILMRCFFAREKMWLPTLINTGIFLLTLPFYPFVLDRMGIRGVPIMGVLGATCQILSLLLVWGKVSGWSYFGLFFKDFVKIFLVSLIFWLLLNLFEPESLFLMGSSSGFLLVSLQLATLGVLGVLVQLFLQKVLKVRAASAVLEAFSRKLFPKKKLKA